jgi:hypothetical protein
LAVVGAIGPWGKVFAITVSGLDGSNDGWLVLILALAAAGLIAAGFLVRSIWGELACFLAVAVGGGILFVGFYDRHNITDKITAAGVQGIASVGWGLNLTIVAGCLLFLSSTVLWFARTSQRKLSPVLEGTR